jgi:hypothetical protein
VPVSGSGHVGGFEAKKETASGEADPMQWLRRKRGEGPCHRAPSLRPRPSPEILERVLPQRSDSARGRQLQSCN